MDSIYVDVIGAKAERCVLNIPKTPQEINQDELTVARIAMDQFMLITTQDDDDIVTSGELTHETEQEQNQDSKPTNKRENPQVGRRLKPTRKSDT